LPTSNKKGLSDSHLDEESLEVVIGGERLESDSQLLAGVDNALARSERVSGGTNLVPMVYHTFFFVTDEEA
jgi:hypothetical protein